MKFLVLLVACLVASAVSLPANRQKRDILPGDPRYGTDYHLHHHHHDNHNVQVVKSVGDFAGTVNSLSQAYGPPGYQPSVPLSSAESTFELPTIQVNNFKPEIPSTSYGVPVQQNHNNDHYQHHQQNHHQQNQYQEHHEHHQEHQHRQQYYQQHQFEHHYQQPQQHFHVEQQQELCYTPQTSYGPPAVARAAPVPAKAPVTSYGTPVENYPQNTYVEQARTPAQDYSIQIYRSQPVKINFQPQPVHNHRQPTHNSNNNGYHYSQPAPRPAPQPAPQPAPRPAPQPAPRPAPQPAPQPAPRPAPRPAPQPAPRPTPQPGNNGYHYHPQPTARPAPQPIPQPTNNNNYPRPAPQPTPQPTPKPDNTYLAPVEKKPTTTVNIYHPQPAPQPNNQYLTPVVEEKKAPIHTYQPQPTNQYLAPVEQKAEEPIGRAVHDTEAEKKPSNTGSSGSPFPGFELPFTVPNEFNINQFNLPNQNFLPAFEPSQFPELPQFPQVSDFQYDGAQIFNDAVNSISDTVSGYVNQKPAQPEATTEKERTVEHSESTQQVDENGGYVY